MRYCSLVLTLFISLIIGCLSARAQQGQAGSQTSPNITSSLTIPESQVPPDAAVVTIKGLCDNVPLPGTTSEDSRPAAGTSVPAVATAPDCKTIVTRQELEKLAKAIGAKPDKTLALAYQYADMLEFATKGHELDVEKDPIFQQKAKYSYLQTMAQYAVSAMQRKADDFTDADLEKYYKEHPERFVRVGLSQLAVPKQKLHEDSHGNPIPQSKATLALEAAEMKRLAVRLQKEAAAGADLDTLEDRAYKAALDDSVPATDLGIRFDDMVPPEYRKTLFALKAGQVSQLSEDSHEYLFFKIRTKDILPLAEARHWYGQLVMRDMRKDLAAAVKVEFNDKYFPTVNKPNAGGNETVGTPAP
jgi:parvulin-like peptidyl-prolyl isomerase